MVLKEPLLISFLLMKIRLRLETTKGYDSGFWCYLVYKFRNTKT